MSDFISWYNDIAQPFLNDTLGLSSATLGTYFWCLSLEAPKGRDIVEIENHWVRIFMWKGLTYNGGKRKLASLHHLIFIIGTWLTWWGGVARPPGGFRKYWKFTAITFSPSSCSAKAWEEQVRPDVLSSTREKEMDPVLPPWRKGNNVIFTLAQSSPTWNLDSTIREWKKASCLWRACTWWCTWWWW